MASHGVQPAPENASSTDSIEKLLSFLREEAAANRTALRADADLNRKTFLDTLRIVAYPLTVVLIVAGVLGFKSVSDLMESIRKEGQRQSKAEIERMQGEIRATLKTQFEAPNIRALVKDAAKESTASAAAPLIKGEVTREVQSRVRETEPQIRSAVLITTKKAITEETRRGVAEMQPKIDAEISKQANAAESRIQAQVKPYSELMNASTLAALARNGMGDAFDKLMGMSNSPDARISNLVVSTHNAVFLQFEEVNGAYLTRRFLAPKKKEEMIPLLVSADPLTRKAAIDSLTELQEKSLVPRFIQIMRQDPLILVRQAAYHGLVQLTGQQINPLQESGWENWWEKNKNNWPQPEAKAGN